MAIIDTNNCIPSGLRADIMRCSMENKNLLSKKGSIYVGTGESITVGGTQIAKTKALTIGNNREILRVVNGDLEYSTLNDSLDPNINYSNLKLTNDNFVYGNYSNLQLTDDNFRSTTNYSNLKITNDNFDYNTNYSNLKLLSKEVYQIGNIQLSRDASTGYLKFTIVDGTAAAKTYSLSNLLRHHIEVTIRTGTTELGTFSLHFGFVAYGDSSSLGSLTALAGLSTSTYHIGATHTHTTYGTGTCLYPSGCTSNSILMCRCIFYPTMLVLIYADSSGKYYRKTCTASILTITHSYSRF